MLLKDKKPSHSPFTKNLLTTPYMKVLSILYDVKKYIATLSKGQSHLLSEIDWITKIIISHSLYSYEFTDKDKVDKYKNENSNFKQFVNFVSDYNAKVIELNKADFIYLSKSAQTKSGLIQQPSFKIKKHNIVFTYDGFVPSYNTNRINNYVKLKSPNKISLKTNTRNHHHIHNKFNHNNNNNNNAYLSYNVLVPPSKHKKTNFDLSKTSFMQNQSNITNTNTNTNINVINNTSTTLSRNSFAQYQHHQQYSLNLPTHKHSKSNGVQLHTILIHSNSPTKRTHHQRETSISVLDEVIMKTGYDVSKIMTNKFNIFELKSIVGHNNVLPIIGKTILDSFGIDNQMINTSKLDSFLKTVSNNYISSVLYHNSLHGADVTQTVSLYFINSNAEEILDTKVIDILSIIISSIGHDIGHPGLTNNFQINASSDMAITYNDISCLENYHTSKLFKILLTPENNIFDKLPMMDYKTIRKRIISMILATDMANHGKIISVISAKLIQNKNKDKIELISSNNPTTKFNEQQAVLDFFVHSADLAHNTKLFSISLQWVELLSNEFWKQGDKEKSMNLPVSFLCERTNSDVPASQVGFIKGFIIPTFEILVNLFPGLHYTVNNAKANLKEWERLVECGRKRGWTPKMRERVAKYKTEVKDNTTNTGGDGDEETNVKKTKTVHMERRKRNISINTHTQVNTNTKPSTVSKLIIINKDK